MPELGESVLPVTVRVLIFVLALWLCWEPLMPESVTMCGVTVGVTSRQLMTLESHDDHVLRMICEIVLRS